MSKSFSGAVARAVTVEHRTLMNRFPRARPIIADAEVSWTGPVAGIETYDDVFSPFAVTHARNRDQPSSRPRNAGRYVGAPRFPLCSLSSSEKSGAMILETRIPLARRAAFVQHHHMAFSSSPFRLGSSLLTSHPLSTFFLFPHLLCLSL